jgi:hypothetical protein
VHEETKDNKAVKSYYSDPISALFLYLVDTLHKLEIDAYKRTKIRTVYTLDVRNNAELLEKFGLKSIMRHKGYQGAYQMLDILFGIFKSADILLYESPVNNIGVFTFGFADRFIAYSNLLLKDKQYINRSIFKESQRKKINKKPKKK